MKRTGLHQLLSFCISILEASNFSLTSTPTFPSDWIGGMLHNMNAYMYMYVSHRLLHLGRILTSMYTLYTFWHSVVVYMYMYVTPVRG